MSCVDVNCQSCGHPMSRHRQPERKDPENPNAIVCFECLYGPRKSPR